METYDRNGRTFVQWGSLDMAQRNYVMSQVLLMDQRVLDIYLDVTDVNVSRLRKEFDWVTEQHAKAERGEVSEWDQTDWIVQIDESKCGTVCCVAGHTLLGEMDKDKVFELAHRSFGQGLDPVKMEELDRDSYVEDITFEAAQVLGLNAIQAGLLFNGSNTYADVKAQFGIFMGEHL